MQSDGNGGAFIVWRDWRGNGLSGDIYVQRVDGDGVIIAWSDERTGGERDVYAQRIDGNGNILGSSLKNFQLLIMISLRSLVRSRACFLKQVAV